MQMSYTEELISNFSVPVEGESRLYDVYAQDIYSHFFIYP